MSNGSSVPHATTAIPIPPSPPKTVHYTEQSGRQDTVPYGTNQV